MRKRMRRLREQGTVNIEMIITHRLPFNKRALLHQGKKYRVDELTANYLINGFYARPVERNEAVV